jgi:ribonuclease H2 subunit A
MNNLKYNINLNELSHNAALELAKRAFAQGFKITHIYADTVGDPLKYTTFLKENLREHSQIFKKISCEPKADATYKVVSASSICAKVNRDRIITEWRFA